MSLSGIQIQGGITISGGGVYMGLGSGTPSLTLSPTDFNAGTFSGGTANGSNGTYGYTQTDSGDLECPFYNLSMPVGGTTTRVENFFTNSGYDINYAYAFNASFASYTPENSSILFNSSSYLTLPNSGAFDQNQTSVTVECWVYPTTSNNTGYIYGQNTPGFFGLYYNAAFGDASFNINQNSFGDPVNSPNSFPLNTWHHVAMCLDFNSDTITLYVNGVSQGSQSVGGFAGSADVTAIGAIDGTGGYSINNAYITNLRVTKSPNPVYTGNFTVPTTTLQNTQNASTNISAITSGQVQLLLDASSPAAFLVDGSQNNFTVTNNSGAVWSASNPSLTAPTVSNYSGIIRGYWAGSHWKMTAMDPANTGWQGGAPTSGSSLTGTFDFPMTVTPYTPTTQLLQNSWC